MDNEIYLIMENARGHIKNDTIKQCMIILKTKHNIKIIHQVPYSPYYNALDIGI